MADGSIRINTKLETKEAQADLVKLEKECEKTAQKIGAAGEKVKGAFTGLSMGQLNTATRRLNKDLEKANAEIAELNRQIGVVQADTDSLLPMASTDEQAANLLSIEDMQIGELVQKRDALTAKAAEYKQQLQSVTAEIERQKAKQDEYKAKVDQSKAKTKQLGDAGKKAGDKTSKSLKKASKSANTFGSAIKRGIKKLGKMALAVLAVRGAYMAVRKAASAYMEDNEELKQQLDALWSVAGQAIGPFIEAMVKGITTIVSWVNALVKALTGVDLVAKANAAALKKQENATKDAAKAAQLAGFDEMNKLTDNSSSSSGDGAALFDPSMGFEIPNFLEEVKQKLLAGDWFGAGETLGDTIIKWIEDTDWVEVGNKIGEFVGNVVGLALGLVLQLNPFTIQNAVTGLIGGLFKGLAGSIQNWDWDEIGESLVDFIIFGLIAQNPAALILSILLSPNGDDLASGAAELIGSIIGGLARAAISAGQKIGKIAKSIWNGITDWFDKYVDWGGTPGEIISGLWQGIKDALKGAGKWIYDNIWVPFRDGFKKAFGIASPSKKMKELGGYLIDGLKNGIGNVWTKVKTKFTEWKTKLSGWFTTTKDSFKTWGSGCITKLGSGIGNIWTKIKSKFTDAKEKLSGWGATLKTTAKEAGSKFANGLKEGLDTLKNKLKEPINALIGMIEKALNWIIGKMNELSWSVPKWVPGIGGKTFGFDITPVSIPRLAQGGIVNNPGRGVPLIAGEAGREAILPLDNYTEWMDILADKINAGVQKIVVPIYLNGRKIAEEVIDLNNKRNFATNGAW